MASTSGLRTCLRLYWFRRPKRWRLIKERVSMKIRFVRLEPRSLPNTPLNLSCASNSFNPSNSSPFRPFAQGDNRNKNSRRIVGGTPWTKLLQVSGEDQNGRVTSYFQDIIKHVTKLFINSRNHSTWTIITKIWIVETCDRVFSSLINDFLPRLRLLSSYQDSIVLELPPDGLFSLCLSRKSLRYSSPLALDCNWRNRCP